MAADKLLQYTGEVDAVSGSIRAGKAVYQDALRAGKTTTATGHTAVPAQLDMP